MNYFDCKKLKRMIDKQRLTVAELREDTANVAVRVNGMQKANINGSKTVSIEKLAVEKARLVHLERRLNHCIISIPDEYIRKIIRLKVCKGKSWSWIAIYLGSNTADSIRKLCVRYQW